MFRRIRIVLKGLGVLLWLPQMFAQEMGGVKPNIILIYLDDSGYGDFEQTLSQESGFKEYY